MNYYEHHIGDYERRTAHLTACEDGIYCRLIRLYYMEEAPLPNDMKALQRRVRAHSREEKAAVATLLEEFFTLDADANVWRQKRCDEEIARYQDKQQKAKRSANARWNKGKPHSEGNANASPNAMQTDMRTHSGGNAHQTPDTRHQTPDISNNPIGLSSAAPESGTADPPPQEGGNPPNSGLPDCPHAEIIELWRKHMPHLTQPRTWEGSRRTNLRARWVQASRPSEYSPAGYRTREEGLHWWDTFFAYIATGTTLPQGYGQGDRKWLPTLDWLAKAENFNKVIEQRYEP